MIRAELSQKIDATGIIIVGDGKEKVINLLIGYSDDVIYDCLGLIGQRVFLIDRPTPDFSKMILDLKAAQLSEPSAVVKPPRWEQKKDYRNRQKHFKGKL